ncbi:MAG: FtsK/SpoIIIE domain-containing protein [Acidimicrobiia bacterium]|nr:FtsK/SpoIIIE domain-containing protein [Acidimicrobiia bacterium]
MHAARRRPPEDGRPPPHPTSSSSRATGSTLRPDDPVRVLVDHGIGSALVVASRREELPASCRHVVVVTGPGAADGSTGHVDDRPVHLDGAPAGVADAVATGLARLRDPEEHAGPATPDARDLEHLLDLDDDLPSRSAAITARWAASHGTAAVVGNGGRDPVEIDLVADGPHALVAGTTGSGKSELLRTLVTSLACTAPVSELNLVLIDYKGGSAFDACAGLPHVVGVVTDLDEHLAERALQSLRAGLRLPRGVVPGGGGDRPRRPPDTSRHRVAPSGDRRRRVATSPGPPGLRAVAGRHRPARAEPRPPRGPRHPTSIGSGHRRPAGRRRARVALRVTDTHDSVDVIGTGDAAHLPADHPGAALLGRGSGAPRSFRVARVGDPGPSPPPSPPHTIGGATVRAAPAVAAAAPPSRRPRPTSAQSPRRARRCPRGPAGPHRRARSPTTVGLVLVTLGGAPPCGAARQSTTTALASAATGALEVRRPDEVHLYVLHHGTGSLDALDELPHCGGVVGSDERERLDRMVTRLHRGAAPTTGPGAGPQRVLLLVDGLDDLFDVLAGDGRFDWSTAWSASSARTGERRPRGGDDPSCHRSPGWARRPHRPAPGASPARPLRLHELRPRAPSRRPPPGTGRRRPVGARAPGGVAGRRPPRRGAGHRRRRARRRTAARGDPPGPGRASRRSPTTATTPVTPPTTWCCHSVARGPRTRSSACICARASARS